MRINIHIPLLEGLLIITSIFLCSNVQSQTGDTAINFPLLYEDISLYDFAEVKFESDKTETPPADLVKKNIYKG